MITLVCPVNRRPGLSPEDYHRHWRDVHARLIAGTPSLARHLLGYTQYPASPASYRDGQEPPWDGVAVAQYADRAAMDALFAEPDYRRLLQPDEEYLSDPAAVRWILCERVNRVIG
jgi:hypothetical protein